MAPKVFVVEVRAHSSGKQVFADEVQTPAEALDLFQTTIERFPDDERYEVRMLCAAGMPKHLVADLMRLAETAGFELVRRRPTG